MARTSEQLSALREGLMKGALAHTHEPMLLRTGEDFTVTYSLSGDAPTMTLTGTFRVIKDFDPATGEITIHWSNYLAPEDE